MGILLPKERYSDIPDTKEITVDVLETIKLKDQSKGEIQKASWDNNEMNDMTRNLSEEKTERKGIALGLCQWKDEVWYQGRVWIPNHEGILTTLSAKHHDRPQAGHGGTAQTTELIRRRYYWPKITEDSKGFIKNCDTSQRTKVVQHAPYGLLQ